MLNWDLNYSLVLGGAILGSAWGWVYNIHIRSIAEVWSRRKMGLPAISPWQDAALGFLVAGVVCLVEVYASQIIQIVVASTTTVLAGEAFGYRFRSDFPKDVQSAKEIIGSIQTPREEANKWTNDRSKSPSKRAKIRKSR